ncbi:MAG TPA: serine hydrolase domain-containing protein [Caulobacteraceae bacterium]
MRKVLKAALSCLLSLSLAAPAAAQEAAPAGPVALPKAPIPYTTIRPKSARPAAPKRAASRAATGVTTTVRSAAPAAAEPFQALTASSPIPSVQLEAYVDGLVREAMARDHIGGVTISVVQNGQVVLKKGYGFATLGPVRPVDPDQTLFRIGSISKTFTWTLLMKEIESGRMRLDAPVNLYLPQKVQVKDQGYDKPVTLRHLMTHTAGFEDRVLGQLFERKFDRVRPLNLYLRQERPKRVREPGAIPSYSNYGAGLAGAALSTVTGKTFEALVEQQIIGPLGLTHTTFREPHPAKAGIPAPMSPALARNLADPLRWTPNGYEERPFEYVGQIAPAASASSTAGDMARYMQLLLNGGTLDGVSVFSPTIARNMRTTLYRPAAGSGGWNYGFEDILLPGGRRGFGHDGATLSFHSNMVLVPELGLGIFISTNTDTGFSLAQRLPAQVVAQFYGPHTPAPPPGSPSLKQQRDLYEGSYLTTRRAYGGMEGFIMSLIGFADVKVTPSGYLRTSDPGHGVRLWAATPKPGVFRGIDGPQTIVFDVKDGKATRFFAAGGAVTYQKRGDFAGPTLLAILALLTAIASLAVLIGLAFRSRRDFRQTSTQARASLMQTTQAVLWLAALATFGSWAAGTGDPANVVYNWPGVSLVLASACALVAAVLTLITVGLAPVIWRGGRRVDSWTLGRKLRFTLTVLIFAAFSADLAYWGALTPWSG